MERRLDYKKVGFFISLLAFSYISTEMFIIFVRFNSEEIFRFINIAGTDFIIGIVVGLGVFIQGANYYLLNRKLTEWELFVLIIKLLLLVGPFIYLTDKSILTKLIENKDDNFVDIYTVFSTFGFFILFNQIVKLVKKSVKYYTEVVADKEDRLTIAITIVGVIVSLIALFR
ncbi:hypothetical protein [Carnobacterium maltaromaticum]|uniref:hypothetical protein n=1 Tax=Carnobacterium maltaromaticum TaxID=2751 RepID=UPI001DE0D330|nr:hypothetical protein [Carnobacterium maltaromaticum]MCC4310739.1 hypothetical protein [Carnobacterium maltaromaticum]